ncbi:MAG TPA: excinuclease ABC subunit UvrC [Desulfobacteraceae bacterium]|nr:excinuclease ABC subunit UvrC [Desulfobacteraceae bacterium]
MTSKKLLSAEFLQTVSTGPGVYQMLGRKEILYVGKAVNLRKRLASYRRCRDAEHTRTGVMLARVRRIETILTTTEKEALILEASLIKKHRPRYNVILRDDKNYPLIKVTVNDPWPRLLITRRRVRDGSRYFGPFASASALRETLKLIHSIFPLRRCPTVRSRPRPCLNFQMGRCLAPCTGKVDRKKYAAMVKGALMVLEGRNRDLLAALRHNMKDAAAVLHFEEAAVLRDQMHGLERTLERQVVAAGHTRDQDVFGLARKSASVGLVILFVRSGMISGAQTFFLPDPIGPDEAILAETILQYYSPDRQPPSELLLPLQPEDAALLAERLAELRESPVKIRVPRQGSGRQLMAMAARNASQIFAEMERRKKSWEALASALQTALHLHREPVTIECIDISNIAGKEAVGSLICFKEGEKYKPGYRQYAIRGKADPDDYAMMREVIVRRLEKGREENSLPDLLLLDGGKGQLRLAEEAAAGLGLAEKMDLAAIAKEKHGEGEKVFIPGRKNPLILPRHSPVLLFLMRVRDEAHRFGISRHRRLRNRKTLLSEIDGLQGIGEQRKKLLLKTFGSLSRIKEASPADLREIPGIGAALAQSIYTQLHGADET